MRKAIGFAKGFLSFSITLYLAALVAMYFAQERLIFPAPDVDVRGVETEHFNPVSIPTPDGELLYALHHPAKRDEATILVFHGNGDAAIFQTAKGRRLVDQGFGVLLVEYRGYPGSTGHPTETGLFADGVAAYDFVHAQNKQAIGLYAHSLGTGVAVKLATERDVFAVVLEAPFDSLMAVAQGRFPWVPMSLLLKHRFRSDLLVTDVRSPMLIMHGSKDRAIPVHHGRQLHQRAGSKAKFLEIENAGHNDLSKFGATHNAIEFFKSVRDLKATSPG